MQSDTRFRNVSPQPIQLRVFDSDPLTFRQNFGHVPFALQHDLTCSGLFTVDRLAGIAEKILAKGRDSHLVIFEGAKTAGDKYSRMKRKNPSAAAVSQLENSNYWIAFININAVDSELDKIYRQALHSVEDLLGVPVLKNVNRGHMNVFMASPHVITPYHMDHEHNFLCQIANNKDVWLWNPDDRANLSELEIERFYCGDMEAARYGADAQLRGLEFHIGPGDALYHPPLAPHWVQNGPHLSISASIGFSTKALDRRARIYRANKILRRLGLHTPPPGQSYILDCLRSSTASGISRSKRLFRTIRKIPAGSTS